MAYLLQRSCGDPLVVAVVPRPAVRCSRKSIQRLLRFELLENRSMMAAVAAVSPESLLAGALAAAARQIDRSLQVTLPVANGQPITLTPPSVVASAGTPGAVPVGGTELPTTAGPATISPLLGRSLLDSVAGDPFGVSLGGAGVTVAVSGSAGPSGQPGPSGEPGEPFQPGIRPGVPLQPASQPTGQLAPPQLPAGTRAAANDAAIGEQLGPLGNDNDVVAPLDNAAQGEIRTAARSLAPADANAVERGQDGKAGDRSVVEP